MRPANVNYMLVIIKTSISFTMFDREVYPQSGYKCPTWKKKAFAFQWKHHASEKWRSLCLWEDAMTNEIVLLPSQVISYYDCISMLNWSQVTKKETRSLKDDVIQRSLTLVADYQTMKQHLDGAINIWNFTDFFNDEPKVEHLLAYCYGIVLINNQAFIWCFSIIAPAAKRRSNKCSRPLLILWALKGLHYAIISATGWRKAQTFSPANSCWHVKFNCKERVNNLFGFDVPKKKTEQIAEGKTEQN